MFTQRWQQFWTSLRGSEKELWCRGLSEGEKDAMRIYRNKDGTWSAMPNWMGKDKPYATNYKTYDVMPVELQEKIGVLLLQDAGSEWLDGIGRRVDDDVFWLEDG